MISGKRIRELQGEFLKDLSEIKYITLVTDKRKLTKEYSFDKVYLYRTVNAKGKEATFDIEDDETVLHVYFGKIKNNVLIKEVCRCYFHASGTWTFIGTVRLSIYRQKEKQNEE